MSARNYSFGSAIPVGVGVTGDFKGLFVGTGGNLVVDFANVAGVKFHNVPDGSLFDIAGVGVRSSAAGNSCQGIITLH